MLKKSIVLTALLLTIPAAYAGPDEKHTLGVLLSKNAALTEANKKLELRLKALEDERVRWEKVEKTASSAESKAINAQNSANSAAAAAGRAQTSADTAHSSYHGISHGDLRGYHGGCTPDVSSGANCMAAAHRFCNAVGFTAGLVQEVGPDAYGVACFR
jgi:hypothetical protein